MSEMPPEVSGNGDRVNDALIGFTGCIGEALTDVCSYGLTIGETYVPFDPDPDEDCEEDAAICSQAWVRVENISPLSTESWSGDCATVLRLTLEVGVVRCLEIPEDGEAPTSSAVLVAAMQSMEDMNTIFCAAMGCEVWESIEAGQWLPTGPMGGQFGGTWSFTVEL